MNFIKERRERSGRTSLNAREMERTFSVEQFRIRGTRLRHYATSRKVAGSILDEVIGFFSIDTLGPGVYSASNRNEYQELIK
jgi:hypothetical protein